MELCTDYEAMFNNTIAQGIRYINKYPHIHSLVLGVSGGIDSTLTAAIARQICNRTGRHLVCVSIPIETNTKDEIYRARLTGEAFADEFIEVKFIDRGYRFLKLMFETFWSSKFFFTPKEKIRQGNIKARLRMIYLYDRAHRENGIVLSTDNLTEYYLNFFTLHGDVGDLGLIQNLWKTEVYGLSKWVSNEYYSAGMPAVALIKARLATPTDGLGITASDFDQLGADNYYNVDEILLEEVQAKAGFVKPADHHTHPVVKRSRRYAFKRNNPFNIARELIVPGNAKIIDKL